MFWSPLSRALSTKCQEQKLHRGTGGATILKFLPEKNQSFYLKKTPAICRRFLAFALLRYGLLGAAGAVGVGLVPKSTVGGASVPAAASK